MTVLKQTIECAKESNEKTLLMASDRRVVGTLEKVAEIEKLIGDAVIKILTMDQLYEQVQKYVFYTDYRHAGCS